MKKLWSKIVPVISPGIRLKLTVFTLFFVSILILASFTFNYFTQKQALSRAVSEQVKAPEQLVSSHVGDLHRFTEALIQLETFRVRLARKTKEAQKLRKSGYVKSKSVGNFFTSLANTLGARIKYSYQRRLYDTYYSTYLTDKNLKDFERQVKAAFDVMLPAALSQRTFDALKSRAARAARSQERWGDALAAETDKEVNTKRLQALQDRADRDRAQLTSSIARILDPLLQAKLDSMQFSRQTIRLLSYGDIESRFVRNEKDSDGKFQAVCKDAVLPKEALLDTAAAGTAATTAGWALLRNKVFNQFTKDVFCNTKKYFSAKGISSNESGKDIRLEKTLYGVDFAIVPKQPAVVERTERILRAVQEESPLLEAFQTVDNKYAAELKTLGAKSEERLQVLREKGTPPYKDKEYMASVKEYKAKAGERDKALANALEFSKREKVHFAALQKRIKDQEKDYKESLKRLKESEALLKTVKSGKAPKDAPSEDELENRIESEKQLGERVQGEIAQLKTYSTSYDSAPGSSADEEKASQELLLAEALLHLRDTALYNHIRLALNSEQQLLIRERRESSVRNAILQNQAAIREFIYSARSETEVPLLRNRVSPIAGGVLAVTRSEAEVRMHEWDGTPILGENGLLNTLRTENIAGYNMIVVDKTRGLEEIDTSTKRLLIFSSAIAFVAILAAWFFSGFAVRRLQSLSATSARVKEGNLEVEFDGHGYDEMATLGQSLNGMVTGLKEREELRGELMAAEEIQKRLLPADVPANLKGRADIAGFYKAMVGIGGDYFDYLQLGPDYVAIAMGDVSSHGVGPALVMAITRSQLHAHLREKEISLKNILLKLNEQLYLETPSHMFVTFFLGLYNLKTGDLQYISAGHSEPLYFSAKTGKTKYLEAGGMPLGMDDNDFFSTTLEMHKVNLSHGDIFLQYTDGLSEAMNPAREQFGLERIETVLLSSAKEAAEPILKRLAHAVEGFAETKLDQPGPSSLSDDIALVCLKRV